MPVEVLTILAGLVSSFLSGLLGIGGANVLAPLLLYLPGAVGTPAIPVKLVTGMTIVQAMSGSILGTLRHRRYGNVSTRLVWMMGPPGAVAALAGALISRGTPDSVLILIFALFSFVGAVVLLLPTKTQEGAVDELHLDRRRAVAMALVIGFFGGMVGIAAIAYITVALIYVLRLPAHVAIGSSLAIGIFYAISAAVGKAATAQIDPFLGSLVFLAALVASPLGAAVSRRTRPRVLLNLLAAVLAIVGLRMAYQAFTGV